jgi:molybdopterin/thiamine biosynthesis adenylyltransferase
MSADLYSRQRRLPEVGAEGQERLERADLSIDAGPAAASELSYLLRAGVGRALVTRRSTRDPFAHSAHFKFTPSRTLAEGAWRALRQIHAVIAGRTS